MKFDDLTPEQKGNLFKVIVGVLFVLCLGAGLAYCTSANALTIPKDQAKCEALAYDAAYMTELRDQGVTWAVAEAQFRPQAQTVIGAGDSYIKDRQDFEYVMQVFEFAFKADMNGMQTAQVVYNRCMKNMKMA